MNARAYGCANACVNAWANACVRGCAAAVSVNWIDGYCLLSYTAAEVAAGLQVACAGDDDNTVTK